MEKKKQILKRCSFEDCTNRFYHGYLIDVDTEQGEREVEVCRECFDELNSNNAEKIDFKRGYGVRDIFANEVKGGKFK